MKKLKTSLPWELAAIWQERKIVSQLKMKSSRGTREHFLKGMKASWEAASDNGVVEVLYVQGAPAAVFLVYYPKTPMFPGHKNVNFEYDPNHRKKALPWIAGRLKAHSEKYTHKTLLGTSADQEWLRILPKAGFKVHSQILWGERKKALQGLMKKKNPPLDLAHLGLEIRKFSKRSEVEKALQLQKKIFTKIPQHGFFSHTDAMLARDKKSYLGVLKSKESALFGIWDEKKMLGFFGAFVHRDKTWGAAAGFTLTFDFPIQRKGVAKTAYRVMLEHMAKHKISKFRGGTSQPAVKGLGDIMRRETAAYLWSYRG